MNTLLKCGWLLVLCCCLSCEKDTTTDHTDHDNEPKLIFRFQFDPNQTRLNNLGQPAGVAAGNAGQSPQFKQIAAHYLELAPTAYTQLGQGEVLYTGRSTTQGGATAIDFAQEKKVAQGEDFVSVPLKEVAAGNYQWLRVSLAYQNYDINFRAFGTSLVGRVASFVGYNTYIGSHTVKDSTLTVNANKLQGYWAFETPYTVNSGSAPATTVPNPLSASSPIPAGSCVVTGQFGQPLVITGNETEDVVVLISLSTNKSFEWRDLNGNGTFEPLEGETVVDMGLRGLVPTVQ